PERVYRHLRYGDRHGQYPTPLAAHAALVWKLRLQGWSPQRIAAALDDERNAGGSWYRDRADSRSDRGRRYRHYIERQCAECDARAAARPNRRPVRDVSDVAAVVERVQAFAAVKLTGRTSSTDRAYVAAWAAAALRHGTVAPLLSV